MRYFLTGNGDVAPCCCTCGPASSESVDVAAEVAAAENVEDTAPLSERRRGERLREYVVPVDVLDVVSGTSS